MDALSVKFNRLPLPAFTAVPGGNVVLWQTFIPRSAFTTDARQTLEFSRQGGSTIPIREIRLLDSKYTVLDYLNEAGADGKPVPYRLGWWTRPNALLGLWAVGAVVVVGGLWPMLLNLLVGAGFGRPHVEKPQYDLDRFKGGETECKPQPAKVTAEDQAEMAELEKRLIADLSENPVSPAQQPSVPVVTSPRVMASAPSESVPAPVGATEDESSRSYKGEFYPVVRPPSEKHS